MSGSQDDINRRSQRLTQMVNDSLEEMHRRRAEFRRAKSVNAVTKQTQATFQSAVVGVYDELLPVSEEVEDMWREHELDRLSQLANATVTDQTVNTSGGRATLATESKPYRIPCQELLRWSIVLDKVARELGFTPDTDSSTTRTEITEEMMEEVEEWRAQEME